MMIAHRSLCTLWFALVALAIFLAGDGTSAPTPAPSSPVDRPDSKSIEAYREQWKNANREALVAAINRLAHEAISESHETEIEERRLHEIWRDPAHQTPEVMALRERLQQLEAEMLATRTALREAVEAIPEVKARRDALSAKEAAIQAKKLEREAVQALLRERDASGNP